MGSEKGIDCALVLGWQDICGVDDSARKRREVLGMGGGEEKSRCQERKDNQNSSAEEGEAESGQSAEPGDDLQAWKN
jgi:hypothetical protein